MNAVYYFGCHKRVGHYLFESEGIHFYDMSILPWDKIDGSLAPTINKIGYSNHKIKQECPQGQSAMHHKDGWTAVSFWDRSIDKRSNSNSNYFINKIVTWNDMVDMCKESYPETWKRYDFDIELVETHGVI